MRSRDQCRSDSSSTAPAQEPPWEELTALRRALHRRPELAHQERETASMIASFLSRFDPQELVSSIGGQGVAAVWVGEGEGPTVLLRCELDGLPIEETSGHPHSSAVTGRSHACGHDGHMAISIGVAAALHQRPPTRGRVVLLFQPAEEVGQGARAVLEDPTFSRLSPDVAVALHNLPGFPLGEVILGSGPFASASRGQVATLIGRTAHAGEPERGLSPALALAEAIQGLSQLSTLRRASDPSDLITVVGATLGERAFGTAPGRGEVLATLRAASDERLGSLWSRAVALIEGLALHHDLALEVEAVEDFPATVNDGAAVALVAQAADRIGAAVHEIERPFSWSEDFGHFTAASSGCLVGLGAGVEHPALHNPDYDFPDALIPIGTRLLSNVVELALARG